MRIYLTALVLALALVGSANAAPRKPVTAKQAPKAVTLFKSGGPVGLDGYEVDLGTVPAGKTWDLRRVLLVAEKHTGTLPLGGEFTIALFLDGVPIAESSVATGQRVNYQGQGTVGIMLPPGAHLSVFVWLASNADTDLTHYYWGAVALIQERPL